MYMFYLFIFYFLLMKMMIPNFLYSVTAFDIFFFCFCLWFYNNIFPWNIQIISSRKKMTLAQKKKTKEKIFFFKFWNSNLIIIIILILVIFLQLKKNNQNRLGFSHHCFWFFSLHNHHPI